MTVELKLTIQQELYLIQQDLKNWYNLFPYEKDYIIRRSRELAMQHTDVLGPDLTLSLLLSIHKLDISR